MPALDVLIDHSRRPLSHPVFDRIPEHTLDDEDNSQLHDALTRAEGSCPATAFACRLLEDLLEKYRIPYFLVRVADIRSMLNSKATALILYKELQVQLNHNLAEFDDWLEEFEPYVYQAAVQSRVAWFRSCNEMRSGRRWKSADTARLPYDNVKMPRLEIERMRQTWGIMVAQSNNLDHLYFNYHAVHTNMLDDVFVLEPTAAARLIYGGFFRPLSSTGLARHHITSGIVDDPLTVLSILQDTYRGLDELIHIFRSAAEITPMVICAIHRTVMRSCRVLSRFHDVHYTYINAGQTRQTTQTNVIIQTTEKMTIQFCPFERVDEQLALVCTRFNEGLRMNLDPFVLSAWISDVFISLHPFEDGNGRVSRILASIPLLRAGLPLLCVPLRLKNAYMSHVNSIRGSHNGDYELLMKFLFRATDESMHNLSSNIEL